MSAHSAVLFMCPLQRVRFNRVSSTRENARIVEDFTLRVLLSASVLSTGW